MKSLTIATLLVAVAMAVPQQYVEYGPEASASSYGGGSISSQGVSMEQWAALNPYGSGAGVPADIQKQWESFLVYLPYLRGPQGFTGEKGEQGLNGLNGAPGMDGAPGCNGKDGLPGPAGPAGYSGPAGPPGGPGSKGPVGPPGYNGAPGKDGYNGAPGPAGPVGPQGYPGATGKNGASYSAPSYAPQQPAYSAPSSYVPVSSSMYAVAPAYRAPAASSAYQG